jgi:Uma2 family endonuclease
MASNTINHNRLVMRFADQFSSEYPKLMIGAVFTIGNMEAGWATFADLSGLYRPLAHDPRDRNVITNPRFLGEVTSNASERIDRGPKLELYRTLPSVESVILVSHRRPHVEVHRRGNRGFWTVTEATTGELQITADLVVDVDTLYRDIY